MLTETAPHAPRPPTPFSVRDVPALPQVSAAARAPAEFPTGVKEVPGQRLRFHSSLHFLAYFVRALQNPSYCHWLI
jgi:hypothetical protein